MKNIHTSIIALIFSFFISKNITAQQIPTVTNFIYQPSLFNPARVGADQDFIGILYRQQFLDLDKKYAPRNIFLNTDLSKTIGLSDRVGIGVNLITDKVHLFNRTNINGFFSYHLTPQESEHQFSAGISAGYLSQRLDFSDVKITDPTGDNLIFGGEKNAGTFDGGFGIHYRFDKVFNLDIASPQLFTSDLTYQDSSGFNHIPHLLAAASYKIETESITLTPQLLYSGTFGADKNKSYVDLNLQLGFLENQLWVAGGYRLDAETFMASVGANFQGIQLSGTFESHSALGGTVEIAARYNFRSEDDVDNPTSVISPTPAPANNSGRSKTELERELTKQKYRSNNAAASTKKTENEVNRLLDLANSNYKMATATTNQEARALNAKKARANLEQIEPKMQNLKINIATIKEAQSNASSIIAETKSRNINIRKSEKTLKQINKEYNVADLKVKAVDAKYQTLKNNLERFEKQHGLFAIDIKQLMTRRDWDGLQKYYQKGLDNTLVKPKNISPVKVEQVANSMKLTYQFPSDEEQYNLEKDLEKVRLMTAHVVSKINEIQKQGLQVESVVIQADLALSNTMTQYDKNSNYNGEFGATHSISLKTTDRESGTSISKKDLIIKTGTINLEKLVALKLYGIRRYMAQQITQKDVLINLELTTGNFDQRFTQLYTVAIKVKQ